MNWRETIALLLPWNLIQAVVGTGPVKKRLLAGARGDARDVLEIGCATGNVADVYAGANYTGIDTDARSIRVAAARHAGPGFRFLCGDVRCADLPAGGFDLVVISHTCHHIPDELLCEILKTAHRLLRPAGRLVILDMQRPEPTDPPGKRFYHWLDRGGHFRTLDELCALVVRAASFRITTRELHVCHKAGIRIIDQLLIEASPGGTS